MPVMQRRTRRSSEISSSTRRLYASSFARLSRSFKSVRRYSHAMTPVPTCKRHQDFDSSNQSRHPALLNRGTRAAQRAPASLPCKLPKPTAAY